MGARGEWPEARGQRREARGERREASGGWRVASGVGRMKSAVGTEPSRLPVVELLAESIEFQHGFQCFWAIEVQGNFPAKQAHGGKQAKKTKHMITM